VADRIGLSFKKTEDDQELLEFLEKKSDIIGYSAYIKTILKKEMQAEKAEKE